MTNFITKPALTLKALFTVAAVATAVVAMPSGPDFAFGVSPAHAKPISPVSKKKLKDICERVGGEWKEYSDGTYRCKTKRTLVICFINDGKTICAGESKGQPAPPPNKTGKATAPKGMVTGR